MTSKNQEPSKLLTTAARNLLRPIGLSQKGRSRVWLDDRGWWVCVVEFQPGWSAGSYLNVGCMWLWIEKDYVSFDEGHRVESLVKFEDSIQFENEAARLANCAREEVHRYRQLFPNIESVSEFYLGKPAINRGHWQNFHAGIACAISGKPTEAIRFFDQFLDEKNNRTDWLITAQAEAERLKALVENTLEFRQVLTKRVQNTRKLQKLSNVDEINFDDFMSVSD